VEINRGKGGEGEMKRRERNGSSDVVFEKILSQYRKKNNSIPCHTFT
jgi:hypothetical protein